MFTQGIRATLKRYAPLRGYALRFLDIQIGMLVCSVIGGAAAVITPYITKLTFDFAYPNKDLLLLVVLAATGLTLILFSTAVNAIQQYLQLYGSQNLTFALRAGFLRHLYRLPLSFFHSRSTGEHLYRLNSDIAGTAGFLGGLVPNVANPFVSALFPLCAVVWLDWRFAILAAAVAPAFALHSQYFGKRQRALARETAQESQAVSSEATDRLGQIKLVKAFGRERRELREYLSNQIKLMRLAYRRYWLNLKSRTSSSLFTSVLHSGLGLYLGYRVIRGDMSLGTLIALAMYFQQLTGATQNLAGLYQNLLRELVPVDRVLDVFEEQGTIVEKPDAVKLTRLAGRVSFRQVHFAYPAGEAVLEGLDLEILPGQTVAIVGPSGAGKTTILNLLLRLYDPDEGSICVDGYDLRDLKLSSFRYQVGAALQETYLFNTSIHENICYGNPSAAHEDIIEAATLADAHEFIEQLSQGYATRVGEAGCNLSMGQRQRIGIARALVKKPKILVLDEATASLSSTSEAAILDAVRPRTAETTLIVITHRLTAIHKADRIFVLQDGRITERGAHEELLASNGLYRRLWDRQFGRREEEGAVELDTLCGAGDRDV